MKRFLSTLFACVFVLGALAQRALMIERASGVTDAVALADVDSLSFSADGSVMRVATSYGITEVGVGEIECLCCGELPASLKVNYSGTNALIVNPYFAKGVSVTKNGAHVVIQNDNQEEELVFSLTGETSDGSLLYNGSYKTTMVLNGVSINNPSGSAIDIECGKRVALELVKGTVNTLSDGVGGDWKAALYCKGHLEVDKAGTLNVKGNTRHAISAKEYIQLKKADGTINILGAQNDGIHCGQYFLANGYAVNISGVGGDGIQAELSGDESYNQDYADGSMWIQGGSFSIDCKGDDAAGLKADTDIFINEERNEPNISITMAGAGSKGMKANNVNIAAGAITIKNSGTALVEGTDVQTAKCISADKSVSIVGGNLNLTATGAGGKCIKSDGTLVIGDKQTGDGPKLIASTTGAKYSTGSTGGTSGGGGWRPGGGGRPGETSSGSSAKAIKAQGAISIYGGETEITTATDGAEGLESKTSVNIAGGRQYLKCYDDCINSSGTITFDGGVTVCYSTGNDAVDSNYGRTGAIVIGDGAVLTYSTKGGPEMGFDCDGNNYIQIKGKGIAISAGGNQGGSSNSTITNASQGYNFVTTTISYQSGRYYTLADKSGNNLVTYSFEGKVSSSCSMFTANGMTKGSTYTVAYSTSEPTDASVAFHGLYLGSSAKGTTSVTSFTAK